MTGQEEDGLRARSVSPRRKLEVLERLACRVSETNHSREERHFRDKLQLSQPMCELLEELWRP